MICPKPCAAKSDTGRRWTRSGPVWFGASFFSVTKSCDSSGLPHNGPQYGGGLMMLLPFVPCVGGQLKRRMGQGDMGRGMPPKGICLYVGSVLDSSTPLYSL